MKVEEIVAFEAGLHKYFASAQGPLMTDLEKKRALDDDLKKRLTDGIKEFKANFASDHEVGGDKAPKAETNGKPAPSKDGGKPAEKQVAPAQVH